MYRVTYVVLAVAIIQYEHLEQGTFQALILQAAQSKLFTSPAGHCEKDGRSHASQSRTEDVRCMYLQQMPRY